MDRIIQLEHTKFPVFWQNFQIPCVFPDGAIFCTFFLFSPGDGVFTTTYHEGEDDGDGLDGLDGPEDGETQHLDGSKEVDAAEGHVAKEDVVRLVLGGHEDAENTLTQLYTFHGGHAHVEEDAV